MARWGSSASREAFWVKDALTFTPAELAALAVWFTLPWTIKMVFGQLADSVPMFGSQRRAYVFIGASLVASGLILLAGAAGGWITFAGKNALYVTAQLLIVIGVVFQDVVADAMTTEVVDRERARRHAAAEGRDRPRARHGAGAGPAGAVVGHLVGGRDCRAGSRRSAATRRCSCCGLIVPAISLTGAMLVRLEAGELKPIDWRILGGGIAVRRRRPRHRPERIAASARRSSLSSRWPWSR